MPNTATTFGALIATAVLIAGCGSSSNDGASGDGNTLTFVTYGSAFQQAQEDTILKPFEQASGVDVSVESPTDLAKLKVMVQSGKPTWDVYLASQQDVPAYCDTYFEKLDMTNLKADQFAPGTVHDCGV